MPSARRGKPARPSRPVLDAAGLSLPTTPEAGSPPKGTRGSWGSPLRPNRQRGTPLWGTTVQAPTRRWGSCTACVGLRKTGRLDPFPGQRGTATTGHPTPTRTAAEDAAGGMVPKPPGTLPSRSLGGPSWKARSQTNGLPRKERETSGPLPPFTPTSHGGIRGDHEGPKGRVDGDHKWPENMESNCMP